MVKYWVLIILCWQAKDERKGEVLLLLTSKGTILCHFSYHKCKLIASISYLSGVLASLSKQL